jgi:hypothetical protein
MTMTNCQLQFSALLASNLAYITSTNICLMLFVDLQSGFIKYLTFQQNNNQRLEVGLYLIKWPNRDGYLALVE